MATVSIYRDCCSTTYTFDSEERAIASHVDWHNFHHSKGRRDYRLTADEQPIRPLREVLDEHMASLDVEPGAGISALTGEECC